MQMVKMCEDNENQPVDKMCYLKNQTGDDFTHTPNPAWARVPGDDIHMFLVEI